MMNNFTLINKVPYNQQQRSHYRSSERVKNHSPNMYNDNNNNNYMNNINTIKNIRNQNQNNIRSKKINKNNNIRYINQKYPTNNPNQINYSQSMAMMKQLKANNHKQIYLEGELNNFMNNQQNIYGISNINKPKERIINNNFPNNNPNNFNNYGQRISNVDRTKNNRGMPKKSPIPAPKGFMTGKYLNNSNMSTVSRYSNNTYNASYHMSDSQLLNNMSQISGYSNYSHNNQFNQGNILDNDRTRPYSNNTRTVVSKNRKNNGNISYNKNISNKSEKRNNNIKSSNNNIRNRLNNNSPYSFNVKNNNYINNNMNMGNGLTKTKYVKKSPNPQDQFFSNTINNMNMKKNINQNQIQNQNQINYNPYNNNSFGNMSNISHNATNSSYLSKINQNNVYNPNVNIFENIQNETNYIIQNPRPMTSHSYKSRSNNTNIRKKNNMKNKGNMIQNNSYIPINQNEINYQNYNSNDVKQKIKMKMMLNNHSKMNNFNNNYINGYNTHTNKRERSANLPQRRNNINNNYNHMNQMVNLHIINKGQIINNNYNNINNMNNNMNNLFIYKYDESQNNLNNIKSRKYRNAKMNFSKRKKNVLKNNYINNNFDVSDDELNLNILNDIQNFRDNSKKKRIRNNSSTGVGITGELNNLINARNILRGQQNIHKNNNISKISLNQSQLSSQSKISNQIKRSFIAKKIRKIHHFTHVGFNGEKDKEYNQDIAFLEKNFAGNKTFLYMAVCDGHGVEGHEVSGFIKRTLPKDLSNNLINKEILTSDKNKKKKIYNIIGSTFIKVNEKLISNESINSIFSGTTCVSLIYTPIKLICANIGDSRAVIGRYDKNNKRWMSINLSRDHKPTEEDEARRILKKGGRIKPFLDEETGAEVGPPRVWVRDDEVPGLAMTRSFGDRVAAIAGTICVPEIKEYAFHEGDKFVILASDGVWEFISSEECINIIGKFYENNEIVECCDFLYEESRKRWLKEEDVVDDITMLLMFFD